MAWRMLMTPSLFDAAEPQRRVPVPRRLRRSIRTQRQGQLYESTHFVTRKAVNIFRDRESGQQSRIHFFLLVVIRHGETETNPCQFTWLKTDSVPIGIYDRVANLKVYPTRLASRNQKAPSPARALGVRRPAHGERFRARFIFRHREQITRLLA